MKSVICHEPPKVHVFQVDEDSGAKKTVPYCIAHLPRQNALETRMGEVLRESIAKVKRLISFATEHKRFPNADEMREMGEVGDFPCDPENDVEFREKLVFLDKLVAFAETERRFPNRTELPDPFESDRQFSEF